MHGRPGGRRSGDAEIVWDYEVGLRIGDEVFDKTLGLGIGRLAEVGAELVMGGKSHVVGHRDNEVGDHGRLETSHAVGEHDLGDPAQDLETLGQEAQGRLTTFVVGKAHEAETAPGRDGTEYMQAGLGPQSMTSTSPGAQTPGRRPRWLSRRKSSFSSETRRRKLRAEPS